MTPGTILLAWGGKWGFGFFRDTKPILLRNPRASEAADRMLVRCLDGRDAECRGKLECGRTECEEEPYAVTNVDVYEDWEPRMSASLEKGRGKDMDRVARTEILVRVRSPARGTG